MAIMTAAAEMAELVPDNAVLIPIPNHNGIVNEDTDTMLLARAISKLTGRPVANALAGVARKSRRDSKGDKSKSKVTAADMGFRQTAEIPEGTVPYFIDNVVGSGETAKAAHDAFGTGITLAYAKSTRAAIDGLKRSQNEIIGSGPMQFVRPLDQRADLSMTGEAGVRYSLQQYDQHTIDNWEKSNRIVVYTGFDSLKSFVKEALQKPTSNKSMYFGKIGPVLAEKIFLDTGIETEGLNVALYGNEVRKIIEKRGITKAAKEAKMGQLPITETELNELLDVISEPDLVEPSGIYKGHRALTFYKNMNGTVTAVTYTVPDKHDLKIQTMWKHKNNRSLAPRNYANKAQLPSTSKTSRGTAPSQTVTYSTIKVKLSVAQRDQSYMDAVNSGDMETAQKLVDEAARAAGYNLAVYHGTGEYFNVFRRDFEGIHLGNREQAEQIARLRFDTRSKKTNYKWSEIKGKVKDMTAEQRETLVEYAYLWQDYFDDGKSVPEYEGNINDAEAVTEYAESIFRRYKEATNDNRDSRVFIRTFDRKTGQNVMNLYAKINNPFVINGDIGEWTPAAIARVITERAEGNNTIPYYGGDEDRGNTIDISGSDFTLNDEQRKTLEDLLMMNISDWEEKWDALANVLESMGFDGIKYLNTYEGDRNSFSYIALKPSDIKSADPVVYDDNGDVIPLSERFNPENNDIRYSTAQRNKEYEAAVNSGDMARAQKIVDEVAERKGYTIRAYHGTGRADRVGTVFRPDRATSGPMAFFTDNRTIAENYARDKVDTSIAYDEEYGDYHNQFRAKDRNGKSIPVSKLWDILPYSEKRKIKENAKHIAWDDAGEIIIYDPKATIGNGGFNEWTLREKKGNAIEALIDAWLDSGDLFGNEGDFLTVLKLAGIEGATWNNPDARDEKVYDVYLKIQNPFRTKDMFTNEFIDDLEAWWAEQDQGKYQKDNMGADLWDKNSRTVDQWAEKARDNIQNGLSTVWTSIPDAVSDYLREKGYDGIQDTGCKKGGMKHTVWIPFASEQVKSAEAVTYDADGNVIPPSERFNPEKEDIRFSIKQMDMEVTQFMLGLNENNLTTVQEKTMHRQFKELDAALKIEQHALSDRTKRLRAMEAKPNPSSFDREEMRKLRNRIDINLKKIDRLEGQMIKATTNEGYARLMYQQEQNMRNTVSGRTSEEVRATIDALTKQVEAVTKEIDARQKDIDSMRDDLSFKKTSALVDSSAADKVAAMIRKMYNSRINKKDLIRAMTEIRLKIAAGKNIDAEAEELAWKVLSDATMDGGESLKRLRGTVIKLGKGQVKELLGSNSSMKELRSIFAGSGIQVRMAKDGEVGLDGGSWEELCNIAPELDRNATELEQVNELIRFVQNQKKQMSGAEQYRDNIEDVIMDLKGWIASIGVNAPNDPGAMKILDAMNKLINEMAAGISGSAKQLNAVKAQLAELVDQGKLAINMTDKMQRDVEQAIKYNNTLAEQSEAALWKSEKWKLIEQLKSENTQNLLKEQEKWKEKIAKDKKARQMMQDNQQLRKAIHTNVTRMAKLIFNETDLKNIPEHMKGITREMLGMILRNDVNGRKITGIERKDILANLRTLDIMEKMDGSFDPDELNAIGDADVKDELLDALADIEDGIRYYNASTGKDIITNLQAFHNALNRIAEAVADIVDVVHAQQSIIIKGRRVAISDAASEIIYDMNRSRFKGELRGRGSKAIGTGKDAVVYGNMTPVYFFKNLLNRGMMKQWNELRRGENRNGLELQKAQDYIHSLAEQTHYKEWAEQTHKVKIGNREMTMTVGNIMELYAIWKREQISKENYPEMSSHLEVGGMVLDEDERTEGKLRKEKQQLKAVKVNQADVSAMYDLLTAEQKEYLDKVVGYLSNQMSDLGNEASMAMYGIKKFKETWYFPMKVWDGVKSARSDKGISGSNENRAAHRGWSKRRKNNASNALVIGDFTADAVSHIVEMINYNTVAPVIENFNRILNYQQQEIDESGVKEGDEYFFDAETPIVKRNVRIMFQEAYGKKALNYLETFLKDLNGGVTQDKRKTLRERALTMFKKNAVAGSISVAAQQPLSCIRAAMMINPKYLAQAISPTYWKGSHAEMNKYSGVAVIKDMGRFDMNFGASAKEYVAPEEKMSLYGKISDKLTILPELMDRMTWTRMWSAVKLEQHAQHPEMDMKSDEFMEIVADRFNEVMQRTQVYDSIMVKSSNMRSTNYAMKVITSFMAEPTLSLNVLADAVRNVKEKGGKTVLAKAGATFVLSAMLQALVKGLMGSGRTPDEKKTWLENFLYKWYSSFIGEISPLGLIPGYSDLIEVLKTGELNDDAMGVLGKITTIWNTSRDTVTGKQAFGYRTVEDTAGQLAQLFTNIPAKNMMRDMRAMWNWVSGEPYAKRETSGAVLRKQTEAAGLNADNLIGTINTWLGDAGYKTTNKAYYQRMYDAQKRGDDQEAAEIREYLKLAKGVEDKTITSGMSSLYYKDLWTAMDNNKADEIGSVIKRLTDEGRQVKDIKTAITKQYKDKYLAADSAGKTRIRDAIQKAYRKMGLTAEDANKVINGWK